MSSATHQDNRGAKPIQQVNFRSMLRLPLTGTVGEEETIDLLNPKEVLFFADQLIDGARSITEMKPRILKASPPPYKLTNERIKQWDT